jgi:hypothetical protein
MSNRAYRDLAYGATRHGQRRMSQRAIRQRQVALIKSFGIDHLQKGGSIVSFIPDDVIHELRAALDRCAGVSVVKGAQEEIITAFHQKRRTKHTGWLA